MEIIGILIGLYLIYFIFRILLDNFNDDRSLEEILEDDKSFEETLDDTIEKNHIDQEEIFQENIKENDILSNEIKLDSIKSSYTPNISKMACKFCNGIGCERCDNQGYYKSFKNNNSSFIDNKNVVAEIQTNLDRFKDKKIDKQNKANNFYKSDQKLYDENGYDKEGYNQVGMDRNGNFKPTALKSTHKDTYVESIKNLSSKNGPDIVNSKNIPKSVEKIYRLRLKKYLIKDNNGKKIGYVDTFQLPEFPKVEYRGIDIAGNLLKPFENKDECIEHLKYHHRTYFDFDLKEKMNQLKKYKSLELKLRELNKNKPFIEFAIPYAAVNNIDPLIVNDDIELNKFINSVPIIVDHKMQVAVWKTSCVTTR